MFHASKQFDLAQHLVDAVIESSVSTEAKMQSLASMESMIILMRRAGLTKLKPVAAMTPDDLI